MPKKKNVNPFYVLLLVAGAAFAITAMAFGVMTVRQLQASRVAGYGPLPDAPQSTASGESFNRLLDKYGTTVMVGELVLLTIGTVGAIAYDQHLDRQEIEEKQPPSDTEHIA